ncbi:galactosylceramide sulfotransferase-like [Lytechinus variegatus]|uniref:galactosylceramide sulfotransferase-like n=1 Tax=Lytechinus variegatus TaxID=7654 RepID=UPI001BB0DA97|nr:galactosylceramide sulfotransferase-like [Lytechinus variegatus]XP_041459589.1 galactosylceramide sulfotransferase-like [Lytechinus variegatus]XP_041459590.1 galactosylceramide sulfotransferase-like [Lytechinus variegatus]
MAQKAFSALSLIGLVYICVVVDIYRRAIIQEVGTTTEHRRTVRQPQPVPQRKCHPVRSAVFIKTHKTGSTTISTVLNRYGERHNLSFLANKRDPTRGHFRTILVNNKTILPPLGVANNDFVNYKNYNLMTFHIFFLPNENKLKQVMSPEPRFFTILRNPVRQWESAFFFFKGYKSMKVPGKNPSQYVNNFFKKPDTYWRKKFKSIHRNGQWVDIIGSSRDINENMTHVEELIKELDKKLHLVLITDYVDESLILLKRLLCWEFEDLLYVKMNQRPSNSSGLMSEDLQEKIRRWNKADMILYDHFNRTLWKKINDIGPNFYKDLVVFRKMLDNYNKWCNITMTANKIRKVPVAQNSSAICQRLVATHTHYLKIMLDRQNQTAFSMNTSQTIS